MKMPREVMEAAEMMLESKDYVHITEIPNISYLKELVLELKEVSSGYGDCEGPQELYDICKSVHEKLDKILKEIEDEQ